MAEIEQIEQESQLQPAIAEANCLIVVLTAKLEGTVRWASIAVTRLQPRKERGATLPLERESSPGHQIMEYS
ncbi:hypothetical protein Y032_0134g1860 [Ancylostoma ceylanicum]|nr:hypothetical protein Y032_0134g1860 [Ancylostoma ceylanicum]